MRSFPRCSGHVLGWAEEFIGELVRNVFGDEAILIGFGMDRGTVAAASDWGGEMEIKSVRPARDDSSEYLVRCTGLARSRLAISAA